MALAGLVLLWLGAFNSLFAMNAETCTMGAADSLMGGAITLVLYTAGLASLWVARPPKLFYLLLLPLAFPIWLHVDFAARLAIGVWRDGLSACAVMMRADEWELDGRETFYVWLWLAVSASVVAGLPVAFFRRSGQRPAG